MYIWGDYTTRNTMGVCGPALKNIPQIREIFGSKLQAKVENI